MKKLCVILLKLEIALKLDGQDLTDMFMSLSVMHKLMSGSSRWKEDSLHLVEKCLCKPVVMNLLGICQKLEISVSNKL